MFILSEHHILSIMSSYGSTEVLPFVDIFHLAKATQFPLLLCEHYCLQVLCEYAEDVKVQSALLLRKIKLLLEAWLTYMPFNTTFINNCLWLYEQLWYGTIWRFDDINFVFCLLRSTNIDPYIYQTLRYMHMNKLMKIYAICQWQVASLDMRNVFRWSGKYKIR